MTAVLAAMFVTVTGALPVRLPVPCQRDGDGTPGWCGPCRMNIHQEA